MTTPPFSKQRDGKRYYTIQSYGDFPSVTSVINAAQDPTDLRNWKTKNAIDAAITAHLQGEGSADIYSAGLEALDAPSEAAILGDAVHEAIDNYERTGTQTVENIKVAPFLAQYLDLKERYRVKVLATELTLVNLRHRYAGTADGVWLLETWPAKSRRGPMIMDVKSGRTVRKGAALQLAALAHCEHYLDGEGRLRPLKAEHKLLTGVGLVAHVRPKVATLYETPLEAAYETFLALRQVFTFSDVPVAFNEVVAPRAGEEKDLLAQHHGSAALRIEAFTPKQRQSLLDVWRWRSLKEPPTSWTLDKLAEVHAAIDDILSHSWKLEGLA